MTETDKCPDCGVALTEERDGHVWALYHERGGVPCLRNQLAQAKAENKRWVEILHEELTANQQLDAVLGVDESRVQDGVTLGREQLAAAKRLRAVINKLLAAAHYPLNGHHYCRWCGAGTHNKWKHDPGCAYVAQCKALDEARAAAEHAQQVTQEGESDATP